MIKKEIDKVAPTWVSNRKKEINELELDGEDEDFNREFTWDEFRRAVERSKDKSSPRIDGVEYMIKKASYRFKKEILNRLNYVFNTGYMFSDWKKAQTIFIEKKMELKSDLLL